MHFIYETTKGIEKYIERLSHLQEKDGSWRFCAESGPLTDAFMIMTLRSLEIEDEALIHKLSERLLSLQASPGYW
jgi:sporulenol synthase